MASKNAKTENHMAFVHITLELGVPVHGGTLEEALETARKLSVTDVVDLDHLEYNDGSIKVTGVYTS